MTLFWELNSKGPERPLVERDLVRAHIAAPGVLASWETRHAAHWRSVALDLVIGTWLPVCGVLLLSWPVGAVLAAIVLDAFVQMLCEMLKVLLAPRRSLEERQAAHDAIDVYRVMRSFAQPRRPSLLGRSLTDLGNAPLRYYYLPAHERHPLAPIFPLIVASFACFAIAVGLMSFASMLPDAFPGIALATSVRIAVTLFAIRRANGRDGPAPELLPGHEARWIALMWVLYASAWSNLIPRDVILALPESVRGVAVLMLYATVVAVAAGIGWRRMLRFSHDLKQFIGRDRRQLLDRLQRVNGDTREEHHARMP